MKALILEGVRQMELGEWPAPKCGPSDVVLRPIAVGICAGDMRSSRSATSSFRSGTSSPSVSSRSSAPWTLIDSSPMHPGTPASWAIAPRISRSIFYRLIPRGKAPARPGKSHPRKSRTCSHGTKSPSLTTSLRARALRISVDQRRPPRRSTTSCTSKKYGNLADMSSIITTCFKPATARPRFRRTVSPILSSARITDGSWSSWAQRDRYMQPGTFSVKEPVEHQRQ